MSYFVVRDIHYIKKRHAKWRAATMRTAIFFFAKKNRSKQSLLRCGKSEQFRYLCAAGAYSQKVDSAAEA